MKFPSAVLRLLVLAAPFTPSAFAHHSQAMFDTTQEILMEGKVAKFDWVNPHMYLTVETLGPDGKLAQIEGEGLGITQALVDGLNRDSLKPGTAVVVRANPNRGGWGKQVRILDVTTEDGEIHPFYVSSNKSRTLTPATSLAGKWAPSRASLGGGFGAMRGWKLTPAGSAALQQMIADGLCFVEPVPVLAVLDEMRSIEISEAAVQLHFDNTGDHVIRTVHMNQQHPANAAPSRHGHSIGRWEGDTLVIDTVAYEPNPSGNGLSVPSSANKHTVERLTLTEDRLRVRYEITINDAEFLAEPASLAQQWDHRPDIEFSPESQVCDEDVAARYKAHVPQ